MVALLLTVGCKRDHYYDEPGDDPTPEEPYSHDHGNPEDPSNPDTPDDPDNPDSPDHPDSPDNPAPSDDSELITMASVLTGQWRGTLSTKYYDDNGQLWQGVYDTDIQFERKESNTYQGQGMEKDFEDGKMVYASPFSWAIDAQTEDIHLQYADGREMTIYSYHLDNHSFYGTMKSIDGLETDEFNLKKIED